MIELFGVPVALINMCLNIVHIVLLTILITFEFRK